MVLPNKNQENGYNFEAVYIFCVQISIINRWCNFYLKIPVGKRFSEVLSIETPSSLSHLININAFKKCSKQDIFS